MIRQLSRWALVSSFSLLASAAFAATFGTVIPVNGQAADLALDEARSVVYVANYTHNRIDVVSTKTLKAQSSINVAQQPAALALSPDGKYLVIAHVSRFTAGTGTTTNSLTVINLTGGGNTKQVYAFGTPPLGVAFGADGLALVVTNTDFVLFNPTTGYMESIDTIQNATAKVLPVPIGTTPRDIIAALVTASGDGTRIFGSLQVNDTTNEEVNFRYEVATKQVEAQYWIVPGGQIGPRVVSVDRAGTMFTAGFSLHAADGHIIALLPNASGAYAIGSDAIDDARGIFYAQYGQVADPPVAWFSSQRVKSPFLMVADWDNFNVRELLRLPENLAGRSVLDSTGNVMYSVSASGLMVLPVGQLSSVRRVAASQETVAFRGSWCTRTAQTQQITIADPSGANTDFAVSTSMKGVTLSPSSGTTPARVTVTLDPTAFQNFKGTISGEIAIQSSAAVNFPTPVRVLVNNREPDQRGTFFNIPGKLVDIMADPAHNRFFVLRQDKNQVLVFDGTNYQQTATLRTGNLPWSMAITMDRQYLLVTSDNTGEAMVYNLDTLQLARKIQFPLGHYPRWIAASGNAILASVRTPEKHYIDRVQLWGVASQLPSLGIYENDIDMNTAVVASPSGSSILMAQANGSVMLYDANADTIVAARSDFDSLSGAVAALSDELFVVGSHVLNSSLVEIQTLETGTGLSSGFAVVDGMGLRTTAPDAASPGIIQRLDLSQPAVARPVRLTEAPLLADATISGNLGSAFVRTLAPLPNQSAIVSLTTSGFTVLPWQYDAAIADPRIGSVVNSADGTSAVAPGGLISVQGRDLNPVNVVTSQIPLPTLLGDSCLTVNGQLVPMVLVSPTRINGQLPFSVTGPGTMILRTPSGVSNTFTFNIQPTAPGVFRVDIAGWSSPVPTVVRSSNSMVVTLSNPLHLDDWATIYLTGMGAVNPEIDSGLPGPVDPLAEAVVPPEVYLGDTPLWVSYAGLAPGQVGVYQINVKVPFRNVPTGMDVPLSVVQGSTYTTVKVRVVE